MDKAVLIINGKGGVGKDYLVDLLKSYYNISLISSVDLVKKAGEILGCDLERKSDIDRSFLSDLKKLSAKYYDHPVKYMMDQFYRFVINDNANILVYMIREENEILRMEHLLVMDNDFKNVNKILITNSSIDDKVYGNSSDDEVGQQDLYNLTFDNIMNDCENDKLFVDKIKELIGF